MPIFGLCAGSAGEKMVNFPHMGHVNHYSSHSKVLYTASSFTRFSYCPSFTCMRSPMQALRKLSVGGLPKKLTSVRNRCQINKLGKETVNIRAVSLPRSLYDRSCTVKLPTGKSTFPSQSGPACLVSWCSYLSLAL